MALFSRRAALATSTIVAACASVVVPSYGLPQFVPGDERYLPNPKNPAISYQQARASIDAAMELEIEKSEKDFGVNFTEVQKSQIHARMWNATQLVLNQFYRPKEADQIEQ